MPATIEPPADLQDFLQSFVVAILRNKPEDLLEFASTYFTDKLWRNETLKNPPRLTQVVYRV
jgi:hypothetical protein